MRRHPPRRRIPFFLEWRGQTPDCDSRLSEYILQHWQNIPSSGMSSIATMSFVMSIPGAVSPVSQCEMAWLVM